MVRVQQEASGGSGEDQEREVVGGEANRKQGGEMLKPLLWKKQCVSRGELVCAAWILLFFVLGLVGMVWCMWRMAR